MQYAVISVKGKQFKVAEGDEILVDKLAEGEKLDPKTLLVVNDDKVIIGEPEVEKSKLKLTVINEEEKGTKIHVYKFKSKSKYRRKIGSRPVYTRVKVEKIS